MVNTQDLQSGKTSQAHSARTKEKTSELSLKSLLESKNRQPLCLLFRGGGGTTQTVTVEADGALRTELLTLNTGESPSDAVESTLSSILQDNVPETYYLSARACQGILNRAARRGKDLPEILKKALLMQSESGGGCEGGGKGALIQEEKSGTLGCNNDQTLFCNIASARFSSSMGAKAGNIGYEEEKSPTLSAARHDATVLCMNPWDSQSARVYSEDGVWHSLNANSNGGQSRDAVLCLNDQGGSVMNVSENVTATLRAQEHGHQPVIFSRCVAHCLKVKANDSFREDSDNYVVQPNSTIEYFALDMTHACDVIRECGDKAPCLQARMGTGGNQVPLCFGIGNGQVHEAMSMTQEKAQTLNTMHDVEAILQCAAVDCRNRTVRRLTPIECARLQGFPDEWGHPIKKDSFSDEEYEFWREVKNTHESIAGKIPKKYKKEQLLNWYNKLHTDSSEYKMWGNGIALPCALYCMEGIKESLMN